MRPIEKVGWGLVAAGFVLDTLTTFAGLSMGMVETNPVILDILQGWGWLGFIAIKIGVVALAVAVRQRISTYEWAVPYCVGTPWLLAGLSNSLWIFLYLVR